MSTLGVVDFVALWALTRKHRRRATVIPIVAKRIVIPAPLAA